MESESLPTQGEEAVSESQAFTQSAALLTATTVNGVVTNHVYIYNNQGNLLTWAQAQAALAALPSTVKGTILQAEKLLAQPAG